VTELPSGTVTFLITDVEGATRLLDRHPEAALRALDRHEALIREVVQAHRGYVFTSAGDNFGSVFTSPLDAMACALEAQRRQLHEPVGDIESLKVRMAILSGVAEPHAGEYRSPNVYRAYRLTALARGGQVLISQSTHDLLGGTVVVGATLRALGEYRLKDLGRPEQVYRLVAPDLIDFSALDRVLLTILFTDIVDSTATAVRLGDRSWRALIASHHALVGDYLPRFRGREIRSTGDGICAVFNTPTQAIECAVAMCDGVRNLGIEIRAGIHTGECELVGDALEGLAVHVAARVGAHAEAGEVLVTSTVTELVAGAGIMFVDRGTQRFKGVARELHVLRVAVSE
jgi:class 3 adenylate cyclase